jgi:alkylation response protein AidB-like acyl-CoA dehydrogenase
MDFELTEEQKMFQQAIKEFVQKEVVPLVKDAEENHKFPVQLYPKLGKLGFLAPSYPEEWGGGGMGKIGDIIFIEEFAKACAGIGASIGSHTGLAIYMINKWGTEEQKKKFLGPACRGEKIFAFGLTEANAGSDSANVETTAKREGEYYIVNGSKIFITNSTYSDCVTLAVSTDKAAKGNGITILILEKGMPGYTVNKMKKAGYHSSETGEIGLDNVKIPVANRIGEENQGFKYLMQCLNSARVTHSGGSLGRAEAAYETALEYAKTRIQFGRPIGKNQAIAFKLAKLATDIEAARWMSYHVAWQFDQGMNVSKEAAMAKFFNSEVAVRAAEEAMRIHGGAGYIEESPVQRYFRDNILSVITEGTSEILQLIISRQIGL